MLNNIERYSFRNGNRKTQSINKIAFMFGGQGSQWNNMEKQLFDTNKIFRDTICRLHKYLWEQDNEIDLLNFYKGGSCWLDKRYTVLGIVSYQIACINILKEHSIHPDYYFGHSLGETVLPYLCNMQTEKQTILIALVRSKLSSMIRTDKLLLLTPNSYEYEFVCINDNKRAYYIDKDTIHVKVDDESIINLHGCMVAVGLTVDILENIITTLKLHSVCIACRNSPNGQTLSGSSSEMNLLMEHINRNLPNTFMKVIPTDNVAYHSPYINLFSNFISNELTQIFGDYSCVLPTGWLSTSRSNVFDYNYHLTNIINPVYFQDVVEQLPAETTVIEIGSSHSLLTQIRKIRSDLRTLEITTNSNQETELRYNKILQYLWMNGYDLNQRFVVSPEGKTTDFQRCAGNRGLPSPSWAKVDKTTRLNIKHRIPNLWNHSKSHRVFDYKDYEFYNMNGNNNKITYDLTTKDKY